MRRSARLIAAAAVALTGLGADSASAERAVGITGARTLVQFDTTAPSVTTTRLITGLQDEANENLMGMDVRPATGELYLFTGTGAGVTTLLRTYKLDPGTATATFVGSSDTPQGGNQFGGTGFDISPVSDVTRVFQATLNFRMNPSTGALVANDAVPSDDGVTGVAYDRNVSPPPGATTLFGIDTFGTNNDQLVTVGGVDGSPSPNGGQVMPVGALGFNLNAQDVGFDISPSGVAYASFLPNPGVAGLYTIDLQTGAATLVESMGIVMRSLAIVPPDNCPGVSGDDQADQDGDGLGDACDADIDGDGVSNDAEAARGTNPRSSDSDGDGKPDGADACPAIASAEAGGCVTPPVAPPVPDKTAATITISRAPSSVKRAAFLKGVSARISGNEPVSLEVALLGKASSASVARTADVVLAEKNFALSASARSVKLKPKRSLVGRRKRFSVRLQVIATDAAGNRTRTTKTIRVR
jgi:hypothetical protein